MNPDHALEPDFSDATQWQKLTACTLCGSPDFATIIVAPDPHYGNAGEFPIAECHRCGVFFLNPMPTAAYLNDAYPKQYYAFQNTFRRGALQKLIKPLKRFGRFILYYHNSETNDPKFPVPGTILDLGCGVGTFLAKAREKGWKTYGVEPSQDAASIGSKQGLDIFPGTLNEAKYPDSFFDYVRSNHSFEHISDPKDVLREIRRVLKPDGKLFIGVPNVAGWAAKHYRENWWYLCPPVHTFGYSPETLSRLLASEGFEVVKVHYNSTFAGIFGSLQIALNRGTGKSPETGLLVNNNVMRVFGHWLARLTDFFGKGDCMEIIARPVATREHSAR